VLITVLNKILLLGEINTLQGNKNWMKSREGMMKSENFERELSSIYPIIEAGGSDSSAYDNVLELLMVNGAVSLPEAVMMVRDYCFLTNI
jgi:glutamate synthase (NADPH/NADH)